MLIANKEALLRLLSLPAKYLPIYILRTFLPTVPLVQVVPAYCISIRIIYSPTAYMEIATGWQLQQYLRTHVINPM